MARSLVQNAIDLAYTFKFIRELTKKWTDTDAYKLGIIDEHGNVLKPMDSLKTTQEQNAYTIFHRLVWNLKKLIEKVPGGKLRIASYAAALYLIKEHFKNEGMERVQLLETHFISEFKIPCIIQESNIQEIPVINPGLYILNKRQFRISQKLMPIGECLGVSLYEVKNGNNRIIFSKMHLKEEGETGPPNIPTNNVGNGQIEGTTPDSVPGVTGTTVILRRNPKKKLKRKIV